MFSLARNQEGDHCYYTSVLAGFVRADGYKHFSQCLEIRHFQLRQVNLYLSKDTELIVAKGFTLHTSVKGGMYVREKIGSSWMNCGYIPSE
jgi:hypothetical protein